MKMIYAITNSEDGDRVTEALNKEKFSVTKLATTGGFLHKGNTTLLIGTEEGLVEKAVDIIETESHKGRQGKGDGKGATVFVVDVERFEKV